MFYESFCEQVIQFKLHACVPLFKVGSIRKESAGLLRPNGADYLDGATALMAE